MSAATRSILDAESVKASAIRTAPVQPGAVGVSLQVTGEVQTPDERVANVTARVAGVVREIHQARGAVVSAGAPLATIESAELAETRSTYDVALADLRVAEATSRTGKPGASRTSSRRRRMRRAARVGRAGPGDRRARRGAHRTGCRGANVGAHEGAARHGACGAGPSYWRRRPTHQRAVSRAEATAAAADRPRHRRRRRGEACPPARGGRADARWRPPGGEAERAEPAAPRDQPVRGPQPHRGRGRRAGRHPGRDRRAGARRSSPSPTSAKCGSRRPSTTRISPPCARA